MTIEINFEWVPELKVTRERVLGGVKVEDSFGEKAEEVLIERPREKKPRTGKPKRNPVVKK